MRRPHRTFHLLLALAAAACSASETAMTDNTPSPSAADGDTPAPASPYRQNPDPKQRYEITMTIDGAPGGFASIEGSVGYDIANEECLPPRDDVLGIQKAPRRSSVPVTYSKVSDNTYVATVYADRMLEDDYYGNGVCRWKLGAASVSLKASGAPGETKFIPTLLPATLLAEQVVTTYFQKSVYPRNADLDPAIANDPTITGYYSDFGQADRSKWAPYILDSDLFTITLAPKAVAP